jgi:hypothetical protein
VSEPLLTRRKEHDGIETRVEKYPWDSGAPLWRVFSQGAALLWPWRCPV